ncbi:MAG: prepilin-type N-terminal cleavage/methylation domain-containing protein [Pseudomonadota bacterium]
MVRSRGFSLLEVMLALIVVAIGMSVLLTFSASSQRETASKGTGNDYSVVTNEILTTFLDALTICNDATGASGTCTLENDPTGSTAYNYLCGNTSSTEPGCSNGKISDTQYTALKNKGIDLKMMNVSTPAKRSDVD